jgi:PIN domain nuclease of toxin-antitoxin system
VRLLLDTHALLWTLDDDSALRPDARRVIIVPGNDVFVSVASAWEIAIKGAKGRLKARDDLEAALDAQQFATLPITIAHTLRVRDLPHHHRDPFDRMLVAQAQLEGLTIVTRDERIRRYDVATLPA